MIETKIEINLKRLKESQKYKYYREEIETNPTVFMLWILTEIKDKME